MHVKEPWWITRKECRSVYDTHNLICMSDV